MASERLQGEEQFHSKERNNFILRTTFWKCLGSMPKMRLKSAPQKLNFFMEKHIAKSCTLDIKVRSSLIYNTSARHRATRVRHEQHICNTSATLATRVRDE